MMTIIAAVSENGVIGRDGKLPWHVPGDLTLFKRLTVGHNLVMGRKTFESVGVLPSRTTFVLSHTLDKIKGATVVRTVEELPGSVYVCGGGEIYRLLLPRCDRMFLTLLKQKCEGDVTFPMEALDDFDEEVTLFSGPLFQVVKFKRKVKNAKCD